MLPAGPNQPGAEMVTTAANTTLAPMTPENKNREILAFVVIIPSIIAVFAISTVAIHYSGDRDKTTATVMTATLPLYGTWVGTILAFYFSRNAFEAASNATTRNAATFQQIASSSSASAPPPPDNVLAKISVKSLANNLIFSQKDITKALKDVLAELQAAGRYRVIVVDATNKFLGLVYRRTAEAYLAPPGEQGANPALPQSPSLQTYLDWLKGSGTTAESKVVFLAETATLADVDTKLQETKLKDAIITTDGRPDSPVLVYINDNDLNEYRNA